MYQALYRKYRPKNFEDVVGQKCVVEILKNEILNSKINHAYMFFGPRGIGKTTLAKIFARAVNCENPKNGNPCEECPKCLSSKKKECVDIIEIDAASNNGVDEIREIRSKVNLVPAELKYKVYIIDEVHMLTQGAFNALLKTLEEPPEHIIFILATTDPHKVSDTIISRCQCFSFKRISEQDNFERLKYICDLEKIEIDDDVIKEISLYSDGGLRDSLGLLDKLSSYKNDLITLDDFYEMNDMVDKVVLDDLLTTILENNVKGLIEKIESFNSCGKNIIEIVNQFLYYLKDIVTNYYINNVENENITQIENLLQFLNEKMFDVKKTSKPYVYLEIILLQYMKKMEKIISREIICEEKEVKKEVIESKVDQKDEKVSRQESIETKISKSDSLDDGNRLNELKKIMSIRVNNTLAEASKEEKNKDLLLIKGLNDYIFDSTKGYVASEILNANLCASSTENIILSYEYNSVVEKNLENIADLTKIYNELTNSNKTLAIITDEEWKNEKNKYIEFTKKGNKYKIIKEPPIMNQNSELKEIDVPSNSTLDLFGDIVEIK